MSSDSEIHCTPSEITVKVKSASANLLPEKSRERYEVIYRKFMDWRLKNKVQSFSENILMAYFDELPNKMKPSSLWAIYSMLRSTIVIHNNINIADYSKPQALLKRKSDVFPSKKSKLLSANDIKTFLQNAPDE
ncbi:hypothetical protein BDFB_014614 [Asbolus verrucosus]|uniref:Uncharacterized protein n=1 Tax=Asbolus verrucosus TaxID=1661398 RepID=A0A482W7Q6_ASBVE|nr:hypothetical protein BDFB_014614 [Asbolus verrucosus]